MLILGLDIAQITGYALIQDKNKLIKYGTIEIKLTKTTLTVDKEDTNGLILGLIRYGYSVYLSDDDEVCFSICSDELTEIKDKG